MKWTMRDFTTKPIAVRVGQKHVREFLQMCEDEGLRWHNCNKPMEFVPSLFGDDLSITANSESAKGKLMCSPAKHYRCCMNMEVVDFEDFAGNHPKYRIVIESDGRDTKAVMEVNGRKINEAVAMLHPKDKFSWRAGAALAFERLWERREKQTEVREVRRRAKVGEYIKITDTIWPCGYKEGDILKVIDVRISNNCHMAYANGTIGIYEEEYVVLKGYTPEKEVMCDAEDDSDRRGHRNAEGDDGRSGNERDSDGQRGDA